MSRFRFIFSGHVNVSRKVDARQIELPLHKAAAEKAGNGLAMNICLLGVVVALTGVVSREAVLKTIEARVPGELLAVNRNAFHLGHSLAGPYVP